MTALPARRDQTSDSRGRARPSYANVTASLALFVALGGTSWAAVTLPRNSVGGEQIKANAVGSGDIKDGTLKRRDFAPGAVPAGTPGPKGEAGQHGAPGGPGEKGEKGAAGTSRAFAFVDTDCSGAGGACALTHARNIVGVRRESTANYCVKPAPGIDAATSGAAVGVDFYNTNAPEGNSSAMVSSGALLCAPDEYQVRTERIPSSAPVSSGLAHTEAVGADDVGFWILVP
jgi:hypothetical protein